MKKGLSMLLVLLLVLTLVLAGCGAKKETPAPGGETKEPEKPQVKAGFVFIGPIGDGGFSFSHNEGRKMVEKELGVPTIYAENVPEGPDVEKVMKDMIDQGANMIFATSFGYMDYVEKVAKEFPDVKFYHCSGYKSGPNFINYFGKIEESRYLSGIVAGMKTKTNKIGYVAAFEIPEVVRGINAFALGVQSVNPKAEVHVKWIHSWIDPPKAKDAAIALLAEGCDVIAQHEDSPAPQIAAEEKGAWAIGYHSDMSQAAPKANMTSPVWNWGPYYVAQVKSVMDGTWKAENYLGGLKEGIVDLAPLTPLAPEGAQETVDKARAAILSGEFKLFTGPLKDNTGQLRIPAGETMSLQDQYENFDWFVEGVVGKVK